ncbi:hypothetical protein A3D00_02760 [Candidatus Woesebacteria bacterium RIFCSPHIGHO2_02_FULL_38_9]|uniref:Uncharacterized protein n=1 Tax=Candidatus Woesebacteria bacterium RIFCSPHIGHO2_01_FULL_39_28 TaxID=1802496 RepID=A0A1F7YE75_9BACT|nr:MAG: hypothetical protein A2627_04350 [Candidatus Woesebacteria bacterium RIFCSPHIGHO2_01_FULL_39_28]OGM35171.1 MAG: hypothetical protein A3D00_02760 [Candidatus Woesebacteria bacterium RIFCSPHIGHO2_02_FULL_38_9]OGM57761.1 MAG: hypothetical protein A3A50_05610 [Candidatus Woesebacteria bacterium RIFCSPLOWO2_01_FULL_38_20]
MSRSLVLGNGSLLVCLDDFGQVKDFYFDYVGLENQMSAGAVHKVGIWVDDKFSWISEPSWEVSVNYRKETLASQITAVNKSLEVEIEFTDVVYNEKNIFLRHAIVKNKANRGRTIKVFFNQQFNMYGIKTGDTAYFDPKDNTIVHYKGRRMVVVAGAIDGKSFDDYSVGLIGIEGKEGTWKDAEDGALSKNPIEHGSVDSTIAFSGNPDAQSSFHLDYWITTGKTLTEIKGLDIYVLGKTPQHLIESTQNYWFAWVNKLNFSFYGLDQKIVELFKKSLLIMRTHFDNTGAVIASGDSDMLQFGRDNYGYVWPRDAAFITIALDKAGYFEVARNFFKFCNDIIGDEGYFFHKYRPDKSLGSSWHPWIKDGIRQLPIQEDETALVIYALWRHYELTHDLEFIESVYNSLIKKAGDFMTDYRDNETKLPKPSYDIWEMKYGISTFTASIVSASLNAVGKFAKLLGKDQDEEKYKNASKEVKEAIIKYLWNESKDFFYKLIEFKDPPASLNQGEPAGETGKKIIHDETIDASSFYGLFHFGILDIDDEKLNKALEVFKDRLILRTKVGGVARFEGDVYYRSENEVAGNPWFITTMWLAQYYCAKAQKEQDLTQVKDLLNWVVEYSLPSGILSEQIDPLSGEQLSASPLIWSHAAFVSTVIKYLEKLEEWGVCKVCIPVK